MASNSGTSYELLTQALFQDILDQTSAQTISVEHEVLLQGRNPPGEGITVDEDMDH